MQCSELFLGRRGEWAVGGYVVVGGRIGLRALVGIPECLFLVQQCVWVYGVHWDGIPE